MSLAHLPEPELKKYIQTSLREAGVQEHVRAMIVKLRRECGKGDLEREVIERLRERGIFESIIERVKSEEATFQNSGKKEREEEEEEEEEEEGEEKKNQDESAGEDDGEGKSDKGGEEEGKGKEESAESEADPNRKFEEETEREREHDQSVKDKKRRTTVSRGAKTIPSFVYPKEQQQEVIVNVDVDPRRRHLHLEIPRGRSFLDHLLEDPSSTSASFVLSVHFRGRRMWTQPTPCDTEPEFGVRFTLEVHRDDLGLRKMADASDLLGLSDAIHLVLVRILSSGEQELVSSHYLEWRHILAAPDSQKVSTVELKGVGAESNVPVGLLDITLSLVPKLSQPLPSKVVSAHCNMERSRQSERDRIFLVYAKNWWKEYLALRPDHSGRAVKIYVQDENSCMRPVFQYLTELEAGRPLLELPREAAWFVSLIASQRTSLPVTLPVSDHWSGLHTFLCVKKGGPENHALLLCSLFLGFGLDAYVCIGTKEGNVSWVWVVTISSSDSVTFWEATTGARYVHVNARGPYMAKPEDNRAYPYETVGCVFNTRSFYAIIQETDAVRQCSFDLKDRRLWKPMSEAAIASLRQRRASPALMPGWSDPMLLSQDMERELRVLIADYRRDLNLQTRWDVQLCRLIAPVLTSYEVQHRTGTAIATQEFHDVIETNIPEGFAFRALPVHMPAVSPRRVLGLCLRNKVLKDVLHCHELDVKLALRVHTYVYPENVLSVWLILGCKYRTGG